MCIIFMETLCRRARRSTSDYVVVRLYSSTRWQVWGFSAVLFGIVEDMPREDVDVDEYVK